MWESQSQRVRHDTPSSIPDSWTRLAQVSQLPSFLSQHLGCTAYASALPQAYYLPWGSEWPLKRWCPPSVSAIQKLTTSKIAGVLLGVCCFLKQCMISLPKLLLPPPHRVLHCLSLSQPRKMWSPGAVAFKRCQSSHFNPRSGASSASVMMTQRELYLEASDMALCSSPSQSDWRFPEHLGLWFKCSSSQAIGVKMTFLCSVSFSGRCPSAKASLRELDYTDAII